MTIWKFAVRDSTHQERAGALTIDRPRTLRVSILLTQTATAVAESSNHDAGRVGASAHVGAEKETLPEHARPRFGRASSPHGPHEHEPAGVCVSAAATPVAICAEMPRSPTTGARSGRGAPTRSYASERSGCRRGSRAAPRTRYNCTQRRRGSASPRVRPDRPRLGRRITRSWLACQCDGWEGLRIHGLRACRKPRMAMTAKSLKGGWRSPNPSG